MRTGFTVVAAMSAAVVVSAGWATAQTPRPDAVFSAEVQVQRAVVDDAGRVTRELPASRYLLERRADGRLRLTMRATRPQPTSGPLADPYAGMVVDQDEQGHLRVTRADGTTVPGMPALPFPDGPTDDGLVAHLRDVAARRAQLGQALGRPAGAVRGLERYLAKRDDVVEEVLVSPRFALPVEVNVVTKGALTARHQFDYEERADGRIVRTKARSETTVGDAKDRLVSITTLSDVRFDGGAR